MNAELNEKDQEGRTRKRERQTAGDGGMGGGENNFILNAAEFLITFIKNFFSYL